MQQTIALGISGWRHSLFWSVNSIWQKTFLFLSSRTPYTSGFPYDPNGSFTGWSLSLNTEGAQGSACGPLLSSVYFLYVEDPAWFQCL